MPASMGVPAARSPGDHLPRPRSGVSWLPLSREREGFRPGGGGQVGDLHAVLAAGGVGGLAEGEDGSDLYAVVPTGGVRGLTNCHHQGHARLWCLATMEARRTSEV